MSDSTDLAKAAGFQGLANVESSEAGVQSAIAREESEMKAQLWLARESPRDELQCVTRILGACQRPGLAEKALWSYPRGGKTLMGPSVVLAREMARTWGNMRYGSRIVSIDDTHVHVQGFCHDLESNAMRTNEMKFKKKIFRKKGGWIEPDERDLFELVNRNAAKCERNAVLDVMPRDVLMSAIDESKKTMVLIAKGDLGKDPVETIRKLLVAFAQIRVHKAMIEKRLGHSIDTIDDEELADLRAVYGSLESGNSKVGEHFEIESGPSPDDKQHAAAAAEKIRSGAKDPKPVVGGSRVAEHDLKKKTKKKAEDPPPERQYDGKEMATALAARDLTQQDAKAFMQKWILHGDEKVNDIEFRRAAIVDIEGGVALDTLLPEPTGTQVPVEAEQEEDEQQEQDEQTDATPGVEETPEPEGGWEY
jgi:hypothetical protein